MRLPAIVRAFRTSLDARFLFKGGNPGLGARTFGGSQYLYPTPWDSSPKQRDHAITSTWSTPSFARMKVPEPDYYSILGLSQAATPAQIRKAYYRLAKIHHPDKKAPGQHIDAVDFRKVGQPTSPLFKPGYDMWLDLAR